MTTMQKYRQHAWEYKAEVLLLRNLCTFQVEFLIEQNNTIVTKATFVLTACTLCPFARYNVISKLYHLNLYV